MPCGNDSDVYLLLVAPESVAELGLSIGDRDSANLAKYEIA
jgi:hypothetical protein